MSLGRRRRDGSSTTRSRRAGALLRAGEPSTSAVTASAALMRRPSLARRRAGAPVSRAGCARAPPRTRAPRPSRAGGSAAACSGSSTGSPAGAVDAEASASARLTRRSSSDWYDEHDDASADREEHERGGDRALEHRELAVHLDAQRLEDALGGVPGALRRVGRRGDEDLDEPPDRSIGLGLARRDDGARVAARRASPRRSARRCAAARPRCRSRGCRRHRARGLVHPHVQRRILRVREAAVGDVELQRRDAEVEEDAVGGVEARRTSTASAMPS